MIRIILDTNLWISFLISRKTQVIDQLLLDDQMRIVFSQEPLEEFIEVSRRPRLRSFITDTQVEKLLAHFEVYGELVKVKSSLDICRD